jgi:putative PEP-CTERM system histidine kinase
VRDALKAAARQVASYLGVRRAVEALVKARQFESFNRMSAFVVHDLKNLVAQLSLLMGNAARHKDNPEFQADMLETVANVQARMQGLLMQLRAGTKPIEPPHAVPVVQALQAAIRSRQGMRPQPELTVAPELQDAAVLAHRDRLERVIGHLVQNAAEATPKDGKIWVRLTREGERALIEVEDTGRGMSEQFMREQLFKPFESTKDHGMGIGAFESREYIRELGGTLDVESREQKGTTFRIRLPLALATVAA